MVTFKLKSIENDYYTYEVYPEGDMHDIGTITFNVKTHEIKEKIYPKAGKNYLYKAISGFNDENGNYKESGIVAWY